MAPQIKTVRPPHWNNRGLGTSNSNNNECIEKHRANPGESYLDWQICGFSTLRLRWHNGKVVVGKLDEWGQKHKGHYCTPQSRGTWLRSGWRECLCFRLFATAAAVTSPLEKINQNMDAETMMTRMTTTVRWKKLEIFELNHPVYNRVRLLFQKFSKPKVHVLFWTQIILRVGASDLEVNF